MRSLRVVCRRLAGVARFSVACACLAVGSTSATAHADAIAVPGGLASVERLYGGLGGSEPERFLPNLLLALNSHYSPGHNWDLVPVRVELVDYLSDLGDLRRKFGSRIEVAEQPKEARRRFDRLCESLGYNVSFRKGRFKIVGKEGDSEARRRRLALALGWNFEEIADRLDRGEKVILEVQDETAPVPLPISLWSAITGRPVAAGEALERLAKDQRLTLMLSGLLRLDHATLASLWKSGVLNSLYDGDPAAFLRYSAAIRVVDGVVVPPGGAGQLWEELVGESADNPRRFLPALLARKGGRVAYLWESIWNAPPEVASFYLGSEGREDQRYLRRVLSKLDNATSEDFSAPVGGRQSFGAFVRSVPLHRSGSTLDLPGGPGLWWTAIREDDVPRDREAVGRTVRRGSELRMDDGDLILRALDATVKVGGFERPVMPRLVRAANLFPDRRELLTPENVILAARLTDAAPAAIDLLESLPFESPEAISDYLLTVANLLRLPRGVQTELLVVTFQAGTETLKALMEAGRSDPVALEALFREWSLIHRSPRDPRELASVKVGWLDKLVRSLPEENEGPGRAPFERALLSALNAIRDPQQFTFEGVEYVGRRGLDRRRSWERFLVEQGIPSVDEILALWVTLQELRTACAEENLIAVHALAAKASEAVDALPLVDLSLLKTDRQLAERILPVDRRSIRETLRAVRAVEKSKRLPRLEGDIRAAIGGLARELRVSLLANAYLRALGAADAAVMAAPGLVRGHLLLRNLDLEAETDSGWSGTEILRSESSVRGAHVTGAVSGIARALAEARLAATSSRGAAAVARAANTPRLRLGFEDLSRTAWQEVEPRISTAVAKAIEAGDVVVELYRALGTAVSQLPKELRLRASFVPGGRLEPGNLADANPPVALSEKLQLGFALLETSGSVSLGALSRQGDELRAALNDLGSDWEREMKSIGAAMPNAVGRAGPVFRRLPSFESLDHDSGVAALHERERIEIKLAVVRYLGLRGLPGAVGADLFALALTDAERPAAQTADDWEEGVRWSVSLDETKFDGWMRQLLREGRYSLAGF